MTAILKFDFQKREKLRFSEVNYLNYTKRPNFACGNCIFPETRGNKNKPLTHSTPLKSAGLEQNVMSTGEYSLINCKVVDNLKLVFVSNKKPCILEHIDSRQAKHITTYNSKKTKDKNTEQLLVSSVLLERMCMAKFPTHKL